MRLPTTGWRSQCCHGRPSRKGKKSKKCRQASQSKQPKQPKKDKKSKKAKKAKKAKKGDIDKNDRSSFKETTVGHEACSSPDGVQQEPNNLEHLSSGSARGHKGRSRVWRTKPSKGVYRSMSGHTNAEAGEDQLEGPEEGLCGEMAQGLGG